jgi:CRISPR-associated protein Csm5
MKVRAKVVSPVHIGSGRELNEMDFLLKNGKVGLIDYQNISPDLISEEKIEKLKATSRSEVTLNAILKVFKEEQLPVSHWFDFRGTPPKKALKIREFIKSESYYVPGSTIKGFMRTSVLFKYYKTNFEKLLIHLENIKGKISGMRFVSQYTKKSIAKDIETQIFGKDPREDVFKHIRVTDSNFVNNMAVYETRVIGNPQTIPIYLQCLEPGTTFEFEISFGDFRNCKGEIREMDYDKLEKAIKLYSSEIIEKELEYKYPEEVKDFYDSIKGKNLIRIGHSTGYYSKTLGMLAQLHPDFNFIRKKLGMGMNPKTKKFVVNFPKTRRLTLDNQPLGWIELEVRQ